MESIIEKIILNGESQTVEFKRSLKSTNAKEGIKSLVAFLNTEDGKGSIYFGVDDQGIPVGLEGNLDSMQKTLRETVSRYVSPEKSFSLSIKKEKIDNKNIIYLEVKRLNILSEYRYGKNFYIRIGSSNMKITEEYKITQIIEIRKQQRYTSLERDILKELQDEGKKVCLYKPCELKNILEDELIEKSLKRFCNSSNIPMFEYSVTDKGKLLKRNGFK